MQTPAVLLAAVFATGCLTATAHVTELAPTAAQAAAVELSWERTDPSAAWADLPPCKAEDGPGPCLWLADSVGNQLGTSFYIGADFCTYRLDGVRDADFECADPYAPEDR